MGGSANCQHHALPGCRLPRCAEQRTLRRPGREPPAPAVQGELRLRQRQLRHRLRGLLAQPPVLQVELELALVLGGLAAGVAPPALRGLLGLGAHDLPGLLVLVVLPGLEGGQLAVRRAPLEEPPGEVLDDGALGGLVRRLEGLDVDFARAVAGAPLRVSLAAGGRLLLRGAGPNAAAIVVLGRLGCLAEEHGELHLGMHGPECPRGDLN
eukprot:CAMPEP_0179273148 /NCGR_PEP_ID=MMETSP0797-20121207/32865_1 /TAXON_ID=47934 /ORGANISM="Dinophysis acuminata, Strain DAEP01" /LENGTH=209 /DNA_ID=CAMNT_0020981569 /DNA_START=53 /DNA_END=679 /DNA_ORIENTATION=-